MGVSKILALAFSLVLLSLLLLCGSARAEDADSASVVLVQVPASCPGDALTGHLQELQVPVDVVVLTEAPGTWAEVARTRTAPGAYQVAVGILQVGNGAEVHVLPTGAESPTVMQADKAGCDAAGAMAALYVNRLVQSSNLPERPAPSLRLAAVPPDSVPSQDVSPPRLHLSLGTLGVAETRFSGESPELLGGEIRVEVRSRSGVHWDVGFAAAPFIGFSDSNSGLEGAGLVVASRLGYIFGWRWFELVPVLSLGFTDYLMRLPGVSTFEDRFLPRGEIGLQLRVPLWLDLFAEVAGQWEPWTIRAFSKAREASWTMGGAGLAFRLGV